MMNQFSVKNADIFCLFEHLADKLQNRTGFYAGLQGVSLPRFLKNFLDGLNTYCAWIWRAFTPWTNALAESKWTLNRLWACSIAFYRG